MDNFLDKPVTRFPRSIPNLWTALPRKAIHQKTVINAHIVGLLARSITHNSNLVSFFRLSFDLIHKEGKMRRICRDFKNIS